jgi:hypothetical protein
MKFTLALLPLAAAGALLSGCGGMYAGGDVGYGYGPRGPVALADCGGYYDGFYGPVDDGCWGNDGAFWYHGGDRQWHRDQGGHFNHQAMNGAREFHGKGPGQGHAFAGGARSGGDHGGGGGHGGDDHHS